MNKGNSGCPLFRLDNGVVVGVVNAKYGSIGEYLKFVKDMNRGAEISHGGMGVFQSIQEIVKVMDESLQLGIGYALSIDYVKDKLSELSAWPT